MKAFNHYLQSFLLAVSGTGFTIDTPLKVAKYGISSVISLVDDNLIEEIRKYYFILFGIPYYEIKDRAERIRVYLNFVNETVKRQISRIKKEDFDDPRSDLTRYFNFLPESSLLRQEYLVMMKCTNPEERIVLQTALRKKVKPGSIDVNIMTKLDCIHGGEHDATTALRGFSLSDLNGAVIFSAGLNRRLYGEVAEYKDFFIQKDGRIKKRIILKVNDFYSSSVQAKFLAKKGIWISEYRIESGLNCGGHAFSTKGKLIGPILEEFQAKKSALFEELFLRMNKYLKKKKGRKEIPSIPLALVTIGGGVATAEEHRMLLDYYKVDAVAYASLFLLVPEVTNVDEETLNALANSSLEDFKMDTVGSPLRINLQNFEKSTSQLKIKADIKKGIPSKTFCLNGFLKFNTEFTKKPTCIATKAYKDMKIAQLKKEGAGEKEIIEVLSVECICRELGISVLIKKGLKKKNKKDASVSICPNLTLAYFKGPYTFEEAVFHIFGEIDIQEVEKPHMFITELSLNIQDFEREKSKKEMLDFYSNLCNGIGYYVSWANKQLKEDKQDKFLKELAKLNLLAMIIFSKLVNLKEKVKT